MQRNARLHAFDHHFLERALEPHHAAFAVAAVDDQLGDHAVVIGRDRIAGVQPAIDPDMHPAGRVVIGDLAGAGREIERVFGVDPAFDRVALELDFVLRDRQRLARCDTDLFADQVDPGDHFGDRVLDLQAGVHFDEIELAVFPQEFDRAGTAIAHVAHRLRADLAHPHAVFLAQHGGGGFLEHLLVAPLERTVAFAQVDGVALAIAEYLELDMARVAEVFLDIDGGIAEGCFRLVAGLLHQRFELVFAFADLHPAPAAAAGSLDDDGVADFGGDRACFADLADRAIAPGNERQAQRARGPLGGDLVAHRADMFGLGPDPGDVVRFDDLGELGVFGQEAVAGMDRVGMADFGGRNDVGHVEIAVGRAGRADADRVVGQSHMHGIGIGGGMHRHRLDTHFMGGAVDAQRDFAAIGDQDAGDTHGRAQPMTTSGWSNSTGWAFSTRIDLTVPALSAVIGFITFIASTISSVCPSLTLSPGLTKFAAPGSDAR